MKALLVAIAFIAFQGCALFTKYVDVKVPVKEPCLDSILPEPEYPLAGLNFQELYTSLPEGEEYKVLDPVVSTLILQRAYIEAIQKDLQPCLKLVPDTQ